MKCSVCGKELVPIEMSLTRKLINRGATSFLCKRCLAKEFKTTEQCLDDMAERFKKQGCTLFVE